jgi:hypothetical protein
MPGRAFCKFSIIMRRGAMLPSRVSPAVPSRGAGATLTNPTVKEGLA